jgi:hypothetical protein
MSDTATKLLELAKNAKPQYERAEIPGIGEVFLKKLNAGERDRFEAASTKLGGSMHRSLIISHFCFDDRGARLFTDDDLSTLDLLDPELIDHVVVRALTFNSYTKDEQDELRKNSNGQAVSSS